MSLPYISFSYQRPVNLHNGCTKPLQLHKSYPWYSKLIHWLVFVYTLCSYYKISVWSSNYILNITSCDFWRDEKRSFYKYLFFFWLLRLRLPIADCLPQSHTTPAVTQTLCMSSFTISLNLLSGPLPFIVPTFKVSTLTFRLLAVLPSHWLWICLPPLLFFCLHQTVA